MTATMVSTGKLFLYLTILLGVLLVHSCEGQSWGAFRKKHIDSPKTEARNLDAYCNLMMQRRRLNRAVCKPINTFINASPKLIKSVCKRAKAGSRKSRRRYPVVECRARGKFPNCNYQGRQRSGRVRLGCRKRVPVHYIGLR